MHMSNFPVLATPIEKSVHFARLFPAPQELRCCASYSVGTNVCRSCRRHPEKTSAADVEFCADVGIFAGAPGSHTCAGRQTCLQSTYHANSASIIRKSNVYTRTHTAMLINQRILYILNNLSQLAQAGEVHSTMP